MGINVLSLFDGMSCGQIALNKAGIKYSNYYASEIDPHAIKVAQANYPNTIQLGDVVQVYGKNLPKIDLLIGGSPCQGFSYCGDLLNFKDPKSKLFFEFARLLKECSPKYFLLENVKMKKEWQDTISTYLGVEPISINSRLLTAHNRPRLYWTNIPGACVPEDKDVKLIDILDYDSKNFEFIDDSRTANRVFKKDCLQYDLNGRGHGSQDQRAYFLHGKHGCLDTDAAYKAKILLPDGRIRKTTRNECERLQGVPDNYTNSVSNFQALKMLGNGWTVDVIAHLFTGMKNFYNC